MNVLVRTGAQFTLSVSPSSPAVEAADRLSATLPRRARFNRMLDVALSGAEKGFVVLALFLFSGALIPLLLLQSGEDVRNVQEGNATLRLIFLTLNGIGIILGLLRWRSFLRAALANKPTLLLVTLALLSVLWSAAPDVTLRRSLALIGTTGFGVYLAARYSLTSILHLLAWALSLVALLSLSFALFIPEYGIHSELNAGAWRGVFTQKNELGQAMVLSTVTFLVLWQSADRCRWIVGIGAGLSLLLVLLSASTSSLVILLALGILLSLLPTLCWRWRLLIPALCLALVAGTGALLIVLASAETAVNALGKDLTLTGRTVMWATLLPLVMEHLWLGYGYSSFWLAEESFLVRQVVGWGGNAHNGYIELTLSTGVIGLTAFAAGLALALKRAVALIRERYTWAEAWPLLFLMFVILANLTESSIFRANSLMWVLFVMIVCSAGVMCMQRGGVPMQRGFISRGNTLPAARREHASSRIPNGHRWGSLRGGSASRLRFSNDFFRCG